MAVLPRGFLPGIFFFGSSSSRSGESPGTLNQTSLFLALRMLSPSPLGSRGSHRVLGKQQPAALGWAGLRGAGRRRRWGLAWKPPPPCGPGREEESPQPRQAAKVAQAAERGGGRSKAPRLPPSPRALRPAFPRSLPSVVRRARSGEAGEPPEGQQQCRASQRRRAGWAGLRLWLRRA